MSFVFVSQMYGQYIDPKLTARILKSARKQQTELEEELADSSEPQTSRSGGDRRDTRKTKLTNPLDEDESDSDDNGSADEAVDDYYESIEITGEDERALEVFMNKDSVKRKTLADVIAEKIREKETEIQTQLSDATGIKIQDLDDKVVELYKGVKLVLSRYRSGKLPKAFKIIPALANWEQVCAEQMIRLS
jgi:essential nuclear protein 1